MAEGAKSGRYEPKQVDISQFADLDDALTTLEPGRVYGDIFMAAFDGVEALTLDGIFFSSVVSRVQGLHGAIAREIRHQNPHAAIPLIRGLLETLVTLMYVVEHPRYVETLLDRPDSRRANRPKRQSIQALIGEAKKFAPGLKDLYAELNEGTHLGPVAIWLPFKTGPAKEPDSIARFQYSSGPSWSHPDHPLFLAAQALELTGALQHFLRIYSVRRIEPLKGRTVEQLKQPVNRRASSHRTHGLGRGRGSSRRGRPGLDL